MDTVGPPRLTFASPFPATPGLFGGPEDLSVSYPQTVQFSQNGSPPRASQSFVTWPDFSQLFSVASTDQKSSQVYSQSGFTERSGTGRYDEADWVNEAIDEIMKEMVFLPQGSHGECPEVFPEDFPTLRQDLLPGGRLHLTGKRFKNNVSGFCNDQFYGVSVFSTESDAIPGVALGDETLTGEPVEELGLDFDERELCDGCKVRVLRKKVNEWNTDNSSSSGIDKDTSRTNSNNSGENYNIENTRIKNNLANKKQKHLNVTDIEKEKGNDNTKRYIYVYNQSIINSLLLSNTINVDYTSPWTGEKVAVLYNTGTEAGDYARSVVEEYYNTKKINEKDYKDVPMMRKKLDRLIIQASIETILEGHRRLNRERQRDIARRMERYIINGECRLTVYVRRRVHNNGKDTLKTDWKAHLRDSRNAPWKFLSNNPNIVYEDEEEQQESDKLKEKQNKSHEETETTD